MLVSVLFPTLFYSILSLSHTFTISVDEDDISEFQPKLVSPCPDTQVPYPHYCRPFDEAYTSAYKFLEDNLPSWDRTNAVSLGFHNEDIPHPDGLGLGIATLGINISLTTKQNRSWAWNVPEDIYNEYVVSYAQVNEARNNWRPFLTKVVNSLLESNPPLPQTVPEVVDLINLNLWDTGVLGNTVSFRSSQTPLIYDPMSTIVFGFSSCTGVSILFADSLRAAGIPARLAGTPAWHGDPSRGNHNWVEVYDWSTNQWNFIEAQPAGKGETLGDPCDKWFCSSTEMDNGTLVFATRWQQGTEGTIYPMAWDLHNKEVPGVDRTQWYREVCTPC